MHFVPGMTCCKRERVAVGLECDVTDMMVCAAHSCQSTPAPQLPSQLHRLITVFPAYRLVQIALMASCVDSTLPVLAQQCAALPTKTARQVYVGVVASVLSEQDYSTFLELHAAEWARIRGIANQGAAK